ncbi:MAG: CapA family protein [Patescibacteria group bacterium]|nr:CapA family protein [Patescibacteria group bacterium]
MNPGKFVKILSLTAVLLTVLFLILVFYSEIRKSETQKINNSPLTIPQQEKEEKTSVLNFLFFGDLMLDRHVGEKIKQNGVDWLFAKLAGEKNKFFQGFDIVTANLEGAVADGGAHYNPAMAYDFSFSPEIISELKKYNFNFFNLANNHFADQGERGIMETRNNLDNLGFYYSGCQDRQTGDCSAKTIEIYPIRNDEISDRVVGKKIGLAGFSMVYGKLDNKKMGEIIKELTETTDLVIVNVHWGTEYEHQFGKIQQETARNLIDAGADIIIGHHPHVVQGLEIYKNKPIFYSLGNFIFDQYFSADTQEGLAVGINIADEKSEFYLFPLKSKLSQPALMEGTEKEKFFDNLVKWSSFEENYRQQVRQGKLVIEK